MSRAVQQPSRFAAITGAGSGLGRDVALGLAAKGYRVFGTAITPEEITDLQQASGGAVTLASCDDFDDTGIAGVDIYRMDAEGKAVEHWDTLQLVGTPQDSAPIIAPNIQRLNANGMF